MKDVVAALIWQDDKFMICQRPENKSRPLLWEFVGGKVEDGETKKEALVRECMEELGVTVEPLSVFYEIDHVYPDISIHLTLYNTKIVSGKPTLLEHNDLKWITVKEIGNYDFCPADKEILTAIIKSKLSIRHTTVVDIPELERIFAFARNTMRQSGNHTQWGTTSPSHETIVNDIQNGISYAVCLNERIVSTFVYFQGIEPTYLEIDGAWLNEKPYAVVHRVASDGTVKGILTYIMDFVKKDNKNIRIDTHENNKIMQHQLTKNGFVKCGIIIIENGTERIAFQYEEKDESIRKN